MKIVGIIPSRLKSTRVPDKPLVDILGIPMIVHVYKRASLSSILDEVIVATDSKEIQSVVHRYRGKAVLTSDKHLNGTERIAEVAASMEADVFVLINGDEALLNPEHVKDSVDTLLHSDADSSILVLDFYKKNSPGDFKVVLNAQSEVMYISRNDIPSDARNEVKSMLKAYHVLSFRKEFLMKYATMEKSPMEKIEDHEHLRIIENGFKLKAKKVESSSISVDTPDDLAYVRRVMPDDLFYLKYAK
ncbi:MAG: 3-deoxy-manno-octulosonate cytidylyltransferase [Flavobacteriales bacterium]